MSDIYVGELGITRLKQLASILQLPGYSSYKDPEQLRQYISTVLTKTHRDRAAWLRKIKKTKEDVNNEGAKIIELINQRRKKVSKKVVVEGGVELIDQKIRDAASKLRKCMDELALAKASGVSPSEPLPANVVQSLKKYLGDIPDGDRKIIQSLLDAAKALETSRDEHAEQHKQCEQLKQDALSKLEKLEASMKGLESANAALTSQVAAMADQHAIEKEGIFRSYEQKISEKASEVQQHTATNTALTQELVTLKSVIGSLHAKTTGKDIDETKFSVELDGLVQKLLDIQEQNKLLSTQLLALKEEHAQCSDKIVDAARKLQLCESARELCESTTSDLRQRYNDSLHNIGELKSRVSVMEKTEVKNTQDLVFVRGKLSELTKQGQLCQSQSALLQQKHDALVSAGVSHQQQIQSLQADIERANASATLYDQIKTEAINKLGELQKKYDQCIQSGRQMKVKMQGALNGALAEKDQLKAALAQAKLDHEQALQKEREAREQIKKGLEECTAELRMHVDLSGQ